MFALSVFYIFIMMPNFVMSSLNDKLKNFDNCMNSTHIDFANKYSKEQNKTILAELKLLYEKNHFSKHDRANNPKIPKIIHQIWVGPKPIPQFFIQLKTSWEKFHPNWQYKLWTNENVINLVNKLSPPHKEIYLNAKDPREKADLLRYYILYWYGGLYVDADFQCLCSFDELHHYYDFYAGISSNNTVSSF